MLIWHRTTRFKKYQMFFFFYIEYSSLLIEYRAYLQGYTALLGCSLCVGCRVRSDGCRETQCHIRSVEYKTLSIQLRALLVRLRALWIQHRALLGCLVRSELTNASGL